MAKNNNRVYVTFFLRGIGVDPDRISLSLGISPTWIWRRGESYGANKEKKRKFGLWRISSSEIQSQEVEVHIEWVLNQIEPRLEELQSILATDEVEAGITFVFQLFTREWGQEVSPIILQRVTHLNVPIGFSFYRLGDHGDGL